MSKAGAMLLVAVLNSAQGCDALKPKDTEDTSDSKPSAAPADTTAGEAESVDMSGELSAFRKRLLAAVDAAQKAPKKRSKCPDDLTGTIHAYDHALGRQIGKNTDLKRKAKMSTAFHPPDHHLLVGTGRLAAPSAERVKHVLAPKHVLIVAGDAVTLPEVDDEESFLTGTFTGWIHVVELASAEVRCSAKLSFQSSEKVEWTESLTPEQAAKRFDVDKSDAAFHVRVDFYIQGQRALEKRLEDIAPNLKLELRGRS
jgi:hypothetical protein